MQVFKQLLVILSAYFLGMIVQIIFHLPLPGTVLGLIFLFIGLYTKLIKPEMINEVCDFLTSNMAFLFIPAGVGLITSFHFIQDKIIQFVIILMLTTIIVWFVTAYTVKILRKVMNKNGRNN